MTRLADTNSLPKGWLAFELNILRRLKFGSVVLPFTGETALGVYLKRWGARVLANDIGQWSWTKAVANIQNNAESLTEEQVAVILEDAYVPRHKLYNLSLRNWFNETDAWWFDNVRENLEKLESPFARAMAASIGMAIGDYALSFSEETLELRQPLSQVYRRVWNTCPPPVNNSKNNTCANKEAREFIAEQFADLMFLRLPRAHNQSLKAHLGTTAWREEWIRGTDNFWETLEQKQAGRLGTHVETKYQYLKLVEELLQTASHIPHWAVAHVEDGFITTQEIVETIARVRRVDTIFTKDFSELTGAKAVIITA
jgi:adenine-specific DNA methylase